MPCQQIRTLPRWDHHRRQRPRVAGNHHQHRRPAYVAESEWYIRRREPQIALGQLAGQVIGSLRRIRRRVQRPQLANPGLEHRQ